MQAALDRILEMCYGVVACRSGPALKRSEYGTLPDIQAEILQVRVVYGLLPVSEWPVSDIRRVRIFGFSVGTLSPSPQCMRTPIPLWVDGLDGLKAEQVLSERISLI